jgi:hypothetical protein
VLADASQSGIGGWQRFFGTPVDRLPVERFSPMLYTSLIEGYARGRLARADARVLLDAGARAVQRRFGSRASVSLGAVGTGVLGDEPTYRDARELADDVAIARAAGADHLLVYSLDGMLARDPYEAWLDAIVFTEPAESPPAATARTTAILGALVAASRAMTLARSLRR